MTVRHSVAIVMLLFNLLLVDLSAAFGISSSPALDVCLNGNDYGWCCCRLRCRLHHGQRYREPFSGSNDKPAERRQQQFQQQLQRQVYHQQTAAGRACEADAKAFTQYLEFHQRRHDGLPVIAGCHRVLPTDGFSVLNKEYVTLE